MQGPALALVAPLILSFFAGGTWLSVALARGGISSWGSTWMNVTALCLAVAGGGTPPGRIAGISMLGGVSLAQAWIGFDLWRKSGD
ncbi:MAG: hypothetical protein ACKV2U_22325 [Bryobacteraceae bacterium]